MAPTTVSRRWTNNCAKGRRRWPMSQSGRASMRRGRSLPTDGYGFTVKHSADSLFGVRRSMAPEVADLLPLPSSYRRPDSTWPSFSYYSALSSHSIASLLNLFILSFLHEWLYSAVEQFVNEVSGGLWCQSSLNFILRLNEIGFLPMNLFLAI